MNNAPSVVGCDARQAVARRMMLFGSIPLILAGLTLSVLGFIDNLERASLAWLQGALLLWSVSLGGLFWVGLGHLTHAVWSVAFRRVAEMFASMMIATFVFFIPVAFLAPWIYVWMDADFLAAHPIVADKVAFLNYYFFLLRMLIYFAIWAKFAHFFLARSLSQDPKPTSKGASPDEEAAERIRLSKSMRAGAAPFMILFAITVTLAAFDWIMSLEPRWFSTIFGIYVFTGAAATALALITLTVIELARRDIIPRDLLHGDRMYTLGLLLFVMTCFWTYIAVSQYLLIWYANLPEETFWYTGRIRGLWGGMAVALICLRFIIPFALLLSRKAKRNPWMLWIVSLIVLAGQLIDLNWMIMPEAASDELFMTGDALMATWHEVGPLLLAVGVGSAIAAQFMRRHPMSAIGDPLHEKSIHFHL